MQKKIILCDIDDTLFDPSHRVGLMPPPELSNHAPSWVPYNKACLGDKPIWPTITTIRVFQEMGFPVHFWTARGVDTMPQTKEQLQNVNLQPDRLFMRAMDDERPSAKYKCEILEMLGPENILCVFEDQCRVVEMVRSYGVVCYQVTRHQTPGIHQM